MSIAPPQRLAVDALELGGLPGRRVIGGRYQVLRRLKNGDDTETLLASDLQLDTTVVIKTAVAASFSASARMRLEHEAHVLSQIKNGLFAPLLDSGSEGDQVYLVMPFIPGVTLQSRLRQGPLAVKDAITLGRALMTSLSAAHAQGVLHRDIKPANVIVDGSAPLRNATLIDFGLSASARLAPGIREQWVGTANASDRLGVAPDFVTDFLALVGDAAHGIHPIAGQGLNLGLRDVGALVEVIADGMRLGLEPGDAQILARYER